MKTLGELGELGLIERIARAAGQEGFRADGIGDDCAILPLSDVEDLVITTDALIADVHFKADTAAERVGHKAVSRTLSDLAACGAEPRYLLVNLVAPADCAVDWVDAFYAAAQTTAAMHGARIVGGDTSCAAPTQLHVTAVGAVPRGRALLRSTGSAGDVLFVTGVLGGSRTGHHLDFTARVPEGQWLRARTARASVIDITDGLACDLGRLCTASGCGAELQLDELPLRDPDAVNALEGALRDGEDYELLIASACHAADALERDWMEDFDTPLTRIGGLRAEPGICGVGSDGVREEITQIGYEHFRNL